MSHAATAWAMRQRGLKPATKIVLWCLADHHNAETDECFPMQETIADECEMSRASVNSHLSILEELGLLQRDTGLDERTKRQRPTRYVLNIQGASVSNNQTRTVSKSDTRAVSKKQPEPCPDFDKSRVQILDSNLGKVNLGSEPVAVAAREREPSLLNRVLRSVSLNEADILPFRWMPPSADMHVQRWVDDLGLTPDEIEHVASSERSRHADPPDGPKALDRAMQRLAAQKTAPALTPEPIQSRRQSNGERLDAHLEALKQRLAVQRLE